MHTALHAGTVVSPGTRGTQEAHANEGSKEGSNEGSNEGSKEGSCPECAAIHTQRTFFIRFFYGINLRKCRSLFEAQNTFSEYFITVVTV